VKLKPAKQDMLAVGGTPLVHRATDRLLKLVLEGQFALGRLPPEPELAERMRVSRTTVRSALQLLQHVGLISRSPGRGTRVRPAVGPDIVALQRLVSFHQLLQEQGHEVLVEQSVALHPLPSDETRYSLRLAENEPVIHFDKLMRADGEAAIHIWDEVPLRLLRDDVMPGTPGDVTRRQVDDSLFAVSRSFFQQPIDHAIVELQPAVAPASGSDVLSLTAGMPFIVLHETHYSTEREPVAFSKISVKDSFIRFKIVRWL
jgi:DNA-binding GntR family transcriptional regulator